MNESLGPLILACLLIVGFALLWARQLAYRDRRDHQDDPLRQMLTVAAWLCIAAGFVGPTLQVFLPFSVVALLILAGVAIMFVTRYSEIERRSMLRILATAIGEKVPLPDAVRAYGHERTDELGQRAYRLALALEAGLPLPSALVQTGTRMSPDLALAVRVGTETGKLGEAIRRVARFDSQVDAAIRSIFESVTYLWWTVCVLIGLLTFLMFKIVPVFEKMYEEFGLELPMATRTLIGLTELLVTRWWPLAVLGQFALFGIVTIGSLFYINALPRGWPVIHRFFLPSDRTLVLRCLALAVEQRWPLHRTIAMLARLFPSKPMRRRLALATSAVNNGEPWRDALRAVGLLTRGDHELMGVAERVGNLEWALDEAADGTIRRLVYRLRLVANIVLPCAIVILGLLVGFVCVALFSPLVAMIQGLA